MTSGEFHLSPLEKIKFRPMKRLLFFATLLLLARAEAQTSLKAKALLDRVADEMNAAENLQFGFTYILENQQEKIRQETEGTVTVAQKKYRLNMTDVQQLFDGKQLYTIVPDNEEITISDPEEAEEVGINPSELLYFYTEGYDYHMDIQQNVMGRKIQFVKLIPTEENPDIEYLLLGIDVANATIYRLIEIGKNTTRTTLTLQNMVRNTILPENFFTFDVSRYPDYFINEAF